MGGKHYTQEQKDFIRDNIDKYYKDIRKMFEDKFGRAMSEASFDHFVQRYGLRHGKKGYNCKDKKELLKWQKLAAQKLTKPIGGVSIQKRKDGYGSNVLVKIRHVYGEPQHNYEILARHLWSEFYNEKLSKNDVIAHIDKNYLNNDIENLRKVSRGEILQMNKFFNEVTTAEAFDTALQIIRLKSKIYRVQNKKERCKK